jgi:MFS transporter, SP family, major inositol transporter
VEINSIMYYGQRVLIESGFGEGAAVIANIAPGVVAVVGGVIALYNMDRIDRRKIFIIGLSLTTTCHLLIGVASMLLPSGNALRPWVTLILVVAFVLSRKLASGPKVILVDFSCEAAAYPSDGTRRGSSSVRANAR